MGACGTSHAVARHGEHLPGEHPAVHAVHLADAGDEAAQRAAAR